MTDKLTTDELVKLAEFCGTRVGLIAAEDHVYYVCEDRPGMPEWHPDLDANQRDEVVEALKREHEYLVDVIQLRDSYMANVGTFYGKPIASSGYAPGQCPGLAVCRAALKAIEEKTNAD